EVGSRAVVYSVDHEPHAPHVVDATTRALAGVGVPPVHAEDRRHVEFLAGADLVIHDAQYSLDEYSQKTGWGHSPAEWAVDYALAAGAKRLALPHHDPLRDDPAGAPAPGLADAGAERRGGDASAPNGRGPAPS